MIYPDLNQEIPENLGRVHFVGIGGSGMSGIARMMHEAGLKVTGSDRSANYNTEALEQLGLKVHIGHAAENVGDADTLVITGALWIENPEYQLALKRGIPVLHRSQALAWLSQNKTVLAVAGAHGKTTSTGMLIGGLAALGADPSYVNGGILLETGLSSHRGSDDLFVIEADESDRSFLLYDTEIALITNVDPEHLDFYGSREAFMQAFVDFANKAKSRVVISADDPGAAEVREQIAGDRVITFGFAADADIRIVQIDTNGPAEVTLRFAEKNYSAKLKVYGEHNAINVTGAVACLVVLGYGVADALRAVATFSGTKRRFELHHEIDLGDGHVRIYDDYAHHPTEVAALLESAKPVAAGGRIIAVHQPHLYSRTKIFAGEFAQALESGADFTIVLDVDGAREDPVAGVTGALVAERFKDQERVHYEPDWQLASKYLADIARPGDVVITMSCGTVYQIIPLLHDALLAQTAERKESAAS